MIQYFSSVKFCFKPVGFSKGEEGDEGQDLVVLQMITRHTYTNVHTDSLNFNLYFIQQECLLLEIILLAS